jgi:hypothetical protein
VVLHEEAPSAALEAAVEDALRKPGVDLGAVGSDPICFDESWRSLVVTVAPTENERLHTPTQFRAVNRYLLLRAHVFEYRTASGLITAPDEVSESRDQRIYEVLSAAEDCELAEEGDYVVVSQNAIGSSHGHRITPVLDIHARQYYVIRETDICGIVEPLE